MKSVIADQPRKNLMIMTLIGIAMLVGGTYWLMQVKGGVGGAPHSAALSTTIGENKDAPKMIVYTDPLCESCREYHKETLAPLAKDAKEGKLQLEIRPVAIISERSARLTELLMCANDQGAFMAGQDFIYSTLYENESKNAETVAGSFMKDHPPKEIAKKLNIESQQFESCMADRTYDERIAEADKQAYAGDVYSTPTTFIDGVDPIRGYAQYNYIKGLLGV